MSCHAGMASRFPGIAFPAERAGRAALQPLLEIRAQMAEAAAAGVWTPAPPPVEQRLGGVRVLRYRAEGEPVARLVHFHGGAFRLGLPEYSGLYAAALAERCGIEVISPQYRLAPEHPFPAAIADALAVLEAVRAEARRGRVIVSGDSAGGGIAAALTALCGSRGEIDGLVLLSPWLDLTVSAPSYEANAATDPLFSRAAAQEAAELYLQGFAADHPLASPLLAPVGEWPPTLTCVGTGEVLADDSHRLHANLTAAGRASTLLPVAGMDHVAVVRGIDLPGAREAFDAVAAFADAIVRGP